MSKRILVLATSFLDILPTHPKNENAGKELLQTIETESNGELVVDYKCGRDPLKKLSYKEMIDVWGVIADLEVYDKDLLSRIARGAGGSLSIISRYRVGYDSIDLETATKYGVLVTNTPMAPTVPTAEWTISTLLDVAGRRIQQHKRASVGKSKQGPSRLDVSNRTIGIIGTGRIGKEVARLLTGFNMQILAFDKYPDLKWADSINAEYVDIKRLCSDSDFITIHTAGSTQIIGEKELKLMHPTTVLVNCARSNFVDNRAVYKAVKSGMLYGYGLDDIWKEKDLIIDDLNIIASPHVGSDTDKGKAAMREGSAEAIYSFFHGKKPSNVVNPEII